MARAVTKYALLHTWCCRPSSMLNTLSEQENNLYNPEWLAIPVINTSFQQQKLIPFLTKLWHLGISLSLAPGTYPYILLLTFPDLGGSGCPQKVLYTVIALTFEWSSLLPLVYSFFYRFLFLLIWLPASGTVELFPNWICSNLIVVTLPLPE